MRVVFVVSAGEAGQRLDRLLVHHAPALSRRVAAELCSTGQVLVDGRAARKGESARAGARVEFETPSEPRAEPDTSLDLDIVTERRDLVIVNKPPGMPTAPLSPTEKGALANGLVARYPEMANIGYGPLEPGLVHRLDTHTSGVLVAARTAEAFATLRLALTEGRLVKRYLAVVSGSGLPNEGEIAAPIAPHPRSARRVVTVEALSVRGARPAVTRWRVLQRGVSWTLVELEVSCAVRHQIRVHLASLGYPLLGDATYGGPPAAELGPSHALHASYVGWTGDDRVAPFEAEVPLPAGIGVLIRG